MFFSARLRVLCLQYVRICAMACAARTGAGAVAPEDGAGALACGEGAPAAEHQGAREPLRMPLRQTLFFVIVITYKTVQIVQ